jgi:hypothetical protein
MPMLQSLISSDRGSNPRSTDRDSTALEATTRQLIIFIRKGRPVVVLANRKKYIFLGIALLTNQ